MYKFAAIALLGVMTSLSPASAAERLTAKQIRALFPGSFTGIWQNTNRVSIKAERDGTLAGVAGGMTDSGVWQVNGRRLCVTFKSWTQNKQRCGEVFRDGAQYIGFIEDGKPQLQFQRN